MLSQDQLLSLARALNGHRVLSIYLDGRTTDPAERASWRRRLGDDVDALRCSIGEAPREERVAFDAAVEALMDRLSPIAGALGSPGWVGFFTPDGAAYAEPVPVRVIPMVRWDAGPRIAPYLSLLRQVQPVIVAMIDSRSARLFAHRGNTLEQLDTVGARPHFDDIEHRAAPPAPGRHTATRGVVGADEMARERQHAHERMLREIVARAMTRAGSEAFVIVGGIPEAAHELADSLAERMPGRVIAMPALDIHAREAEIRTAAIAGATALLRTRQQAIVEDIAAHFADDDRAVLGTVRTLRTLEEQTVETLVISEQFISRDPATAEAAIRAALRQRAGIEVVRDCTDERFERDGEGLGARLRYSPYRSPRAEALPTS